jgi:uncharacterized protein YjbJ (UPF0337 family)
LFLLQSVGAGLRDERDASYRGVKLGGWIIDAGCSNEARRMNHDRIEGRWKQFKGKVKEQWGHLTEDDLDVIAGRRDQLLGRIQQRHGLARDEADRQVRDWEGRNPEFRFEDRSNDSR